MLIKLDLSHKGFHQTGSASLVASSAKICAAARDLNVQNVFNMDETFILYYAASERVLVSKGARRVGHLVPVLNGKKGVSLAVTASLLSSQLLPAFIIDSSGGFGFTLMHQWKNYVKSTVLFNPVHWMTQNILVLYLEWLLKTFLTQRTLLIVDRATTPFGKWLMIGFG
uniref:DDE-1 domain-containing protein n=1 Tax=Spongospora subterranea TaxID=70186 RepID=A0A0H5RF08_9EUKA|eukprot:CRZ12633.1 hypothetical protein [Spongospora subterranea]